MIEGFEWHLFVCWGTIHLLLVLGSSISSSDSQCAVFSVMLVSPIVLIFDFLSDMGFFSLILVPKEETEIFLFRVLFLGFCWFSRMVVCGIFWLFLFFLEKCFCWLFFFSVFFFSSWKLTCEAICVEQTDYPLSWSNLTHSTIYKGFPYLL